MIKLDEISVTEKILGLKDYGDRVRHQSEGFLTRIWNAVKSCFSSYQQRADKAEFLKYYPLLDKKITLLNIEKDQSTEQFYSGVKELLHVQAKIQFTGWAKNLGNIPEYAEFKNALQKLQNIAKEGIEKWVSTESLTGLPKIEKEKIKLWINANTEQLSYAGYSNEIPLWSNSIPIGAVLLYNPQSKQNKKHSNLLKKIKAFFCNLFTGLPVTHAFTHLGEGKFFHVGKTGTFSGTPREEDFSSRFLYNCEILVPNRREFAKAFECPEGQVDEVMKHWSATLRTAGEQSNMAPPTRSKFWDIISTVLPSCRPKNYNIRNVFQARPKNGYSCSGLVSSALAKYGIDIVEKFKKRVDRASPADFARTRYYDIAFSNDRPKLEKFRKKYI